MLASILVFILVLSILILSHEFGHYWVAKKSGIKVEEFGFGLPPRIWGKKIGETLYSINALPFGGFVKLHGEQEEDISTDVKRSFLHKSKKVRTLVITAGVIMNFLLAIILFGVSYSITGIPRDTGKVKIIDVSSGSPAEMSGLVVGDTIAKVGKEPVKSSNDFVSMTGEFKGKKIAYEIIRNDKVLTVNVTPRENPPEGEGPIGVTITTMETYYPPIYLRPFYGIYYGFKDSVFWGRTILVGLKDLAVNLFKGVSPEGISGPIGIYAITTEASKGGVLMLLNFVGILSVNLAILNILPFPALDGGRLLFIGIEAVTRKKVSRKVEAVINNVGFIILLGLLLAVTIGDIRKLIIFKGIEGFINSMGGN